MIDGPHIFGFSPVALCINLTSALASARLVSSVRASINAGTLSLVGFSFVYARAPASPPFYGRIPRGFALVVLVLWSPCAPRSLSFKGYCSHGGPDDGNQNQADQTKCPGVY